MHKWTIHPLIAVGAGIAAGLLRGFERVVVFDPETGLATPNHPLSLALVGLMALVAVVFFLFAVRQRFLPPGSFCQAFEGMKRPELYTAAIGLIFLAAHTVLGFWSFNLTGSWVSLILGLLTLLNIMALVICLRALSQGAMADQFKIFLIVPIFWGCFLLIDSFRLKAADPVIPDYAYNLLAIIFLLLCLYAMSGYAFGNPSSRFSLFVFPMAIALWLTEGLGIVLPHVLAPRPWTGEEFSNLALALFALLYLIPFYKTLRRNLRVKELHHP